MIPLVGTAEEFIHEWHMLDEEGVGLLVRMAAEKRKEFQKKTENGNLRRARR